MTQKRASLVVTLPVDRDGRPEGFPGDLMYEDAGWWSCWPLGRVERPDLFAHLHAEGGGTFTALGSPEALAPIAQVAAKVWPGIEALRLDASAEAATAKSAWADTRPRALDGDGKPTGTPIGERVALRAAMAGFVADDGEKGAADAKAEDVLANTEVPDGRR